MLYKRFNQRLPHNSQIATIVNNQQVIIPHIMNEDRFASDSEAASVDIWYQFSVLEYKSIKNEQMDSFLRD